MGNALSWELNNGVSAVISMYAGAKKQLSEQFMGTANVLR